MVQGCKLRFGWPRKTTLVPKAQQTVRYLCTHPGTRPPCSRLSSCSSPAHPCRRWERTANATTPAARRLAAKWLLWGSPVRPQRTLGAAATPAARSCRRRHRHHRSHHRCRGRRRHRRPLRRHRRLGPLPSASWAASLPRAAPCKRWPRAASSSGWDAAVTAAVRTRSPLQRR